MRNSAAVLGLLAGVLAPAAAPAEAGEKMTPGPAWRTDYREARREALRAGKPLFLYFTKTH